MIIRFLVFFLLFLINGSAICQTYSSIISDKEIVDFLNWNIKTDKRYSEEPKFRRKVIDSWITNWDSSYFIFDSVINNRHYYNKYLFSEENRFLDSIFTAKDKEFLFQQFNSQIDTLWRHTFEKANLRNKISNKLKKRRSYSLPLFSLDKNYVIITESFKCGTLCGYGSINIYKRNRNGNWKFIYNVSSWVS